jgi:hypothetical protein
MGLIIASTIVGPILALLGALVFLRKCGVPFGPLVRVEVVNQQPGWAGVDAGEFRVEAVRLRTDIRDDQEAGDGTAHHFDLGPSYEEERRMKEEALKNQEHAILQQIVDQNVQLREDIAELKEDERA